MVSATVQLHKHRTLMTSNNATVFNLQQYSEQVKQDYQPQFNKARDQLKNHAAMVVATLPEEDWMSSMRNHAGQLQVDFDFKDNDLETYLDLAKAERFTDDKHTSFAGDAVEWDIASELVHGLIKDNGFHLLNGEPGAGKSLFCLALFRELSQKRTGSFLNLETDVSKNWKLFLVGADMDRSGWGAALEKYHLFLRPETLPNKRRRAWQAETLAYFNADSVVSDSLSPQDIARYREMAVQCVADGFSPLFVFDSYSQLVNAYKPVDEIKAAFANPLRDLKKAMSGTGATTIVLHHTPQTRSGSIVSAGSGTSALGRIPDVILLLETESDNDRQNLVIHSRKRITEIDWRLHHNWDNAEWTGHGCARAWQRDREMQQKIATLHAIKAKIFDWAQMRWETTQQGFTVKQVQDLLQGISRPAAYNHIKWLRLNGLVYKAEQMTINGSAHVFYPYNAKTEGGVTRCNPGVTPALDSEVTPQPCDTNGFEEKEGGVTPCNPLRTRQWIPCHEEGTAVKFNGGNGWHVVEVNPITGMHVIEKDGLRRKDLRKMDLPIHIDENEEL